MKKVLSMLLVLCLVLSLAACSKKAEDTKKDDSSTPTAAPTTQQSSEAEQPTGNEEAVNDLTNGEMKDGKFIETRHISVEVYDRGNDGGSDPTNNKYTDYIKKNMLEKYNVEVEFVKVPRWTEGEEINNLLAAGTAPDICVTYSYPTIKTYADMGAVLDLSQYVDDYASLLPNLWNWLGTTNIYWDKDPVTGTIWAIEAKLAQSNRVVTFVREDWLKKLNMEAPKTTAEFEKMLVAFRDNAELLLGADASKMVPYSVSYDVGWRTATLIESFLDPAITDKEYYVNGFDDRKLTQNGTKEAIRLLNKWYNDGLLWKDFALYSSGDTYEDDMMKAGFVGAFTHNWDYPYRNGEDSIQANLKRLVGEDAAFVAVDCFENSNGEYLKFVSGPIDRKVFFPATNDEPIASMLYLDFISDPETIQYLQIGDEGVTHVVLEDGAIQTIAATGDAIQNSGQNIDMTITCNGLKLKDADLTAKSKAHNYAAVETKYIEIANTIANTNLKIGKNVNVGSIDAETGMGEALNKKRDEVYDNAVVAAVADFDTVWDTQIAEYLATGAQAIMEEREQKWNQFFGDAVNLD